MLFTSSSLRPSEQLIQRGLDGEGTSAAEVAQSAVNQDPALAALATRLAALDERLDSHFDERVPTRSDEQLLTKVLATLPQGKPERQLQIGGKWIAASLATATILLLFPMSKGITVTPVGVYAWLTMATLVGIGLTLMALIPMVLGQRRTMAMLSSQINLGPADRLTCAAAGCIVLSLVAWIV